MIDAEALALVTNCWVPNNPVLPVLIYRAVVPVGAPGTVENMLRRNAWRPDWRDGVYAFHHYHSTAHEALACVSGSADLMLGGEGGREVRVEAGDLLVLPAGTGHCRVGASGDFLLIGAYPEGQDWDICREAADLPTIARIAAVPLPDCDPIAGKIGPLTRVWNNGQF